MSFYSQKHYIEKSAEENFEDRLIYLEHMGENRPGPQLDIGCSIGNFLMLSPDKIEGVDIDREALTICGKRGLTAGVMDITSDNFSQENYYEVIYLRHVIEHLLDPLSALKKIRGALKPNGLLIVETPDYVKSHHREKSNFWDDYTHKTPFTFNSLLRIAFDAQFEIASAQKKPHYGYWVKKLLRKGWVNHRLIFKLHLLLGLVRDDLLFALRKPST